MVAALRGRNERALFVPELRASLKVMPENEAGFERALSELEAAGTVLVRLHICSDPHLDGADLRVAALLDGRGSGDAEAGAIEAIELVWERWIGEYLATHRCM